ncbi:hypothetical protein ACYQR9_21425 [Methylobacterium sp. CM6241]
MMRVTGITGLLLTFVLLFGWGNLSARPAMTGTGGGPETTVTAPYTALTGQTVPSGTAAVPTNDPSERTVRQRDLDHVLDGICVGCR